LDKNGKVKTWKRKKAKAQKGLSLLLLTGEKGKRVKKGKSFMAKPYGTNIALWLSTE
jgi:hypothetical protein